MGIDLVPIAPTAEMPQYKGKPASLHYNWSGWRYITNFLDKYNELTGEFAGSNDGDAISAETCRRVADCIEKHVNELPPEDKEWLTKHIPYWRHCGGFNQW